MFDTTDALKKLHRYAAARCEFLTAINCETSCRDPLAEFAEKLVEELLGATAAPSRVQRGYDLVSPDGQRVQVKYLANPCDDRWINEHHVVFSEELDQYALVIFERFDLSAVLLFHRSSLSQVCQQLGKRHPNQDHTLQLTRRNYRTLIEGAEQFRSLGVTVWRPPSTA